MSSKRILVTGATGVLGSRLVERLAEDKMVTVTATGRSLKPHNRIEASNVRYVLGDLTEGAFVEGLVQAELLLNLFNELLR